MLKNDSELKQKDARQLKVGYLHSWAVVFPIFWAKSSL